MENTFKSKDKVICQICQKQFEKNYNIHLNNLSRHLKSVHLEFLNSRSKIDPFKEALQNTIDIHNFKNNTDK